MGKKSKSTPEATEENQESRDMENSKSADNELSYEEKLESVCVIAKPMATKKFAKKIYKLIKKGSQQKSIRHGLKDVQLRLRRGERGIVVFAGDVTPMDIICHMPIVCEELDVPYIFTPSRRDLGTSFGVKRGSLMVLVREHSEYKELYDECKDHINSIDSPFAKE